MTKLQKPARDAVPAPLCGGIGVLGSGGPWSSGTREELGKLNEKDTSWLFLNESQREWKNTYEKEAMERERKKAGYYKNMPPKKKEQTITGEWRRMIQARTAKLI